MPMRARPLAERGLVAGVGQQAVGQATQPRVLGHRQVQAFDGRLGQLVQKRVDQTPLRTVLVVQLREAHRLADQLMQQAGYRQGAASRGRAPAALRVDQQAIHLSFAGATRGMGHAAGNPQCALARHDPDAGLDFAMNHPAQGVHQLAFAVRVLAYVPSARTCWWRPRPPPPRDQVGVLGLATGRAVRGGGVSWGLAAWPNCETFWLFCAMPSSRKHPYSEIHSHSGALPCDSTVQHSPW